MIQGARRLSSALALLACVAPAVAQRETRGGQPGEFDFYVLALSWSPGFCATEEGAEGRDQCRVGAGLGFVTHGLWPQFERGYPVACGADRAPSRVALDQAQGLYPSEGLARHQWRRHGACSGRSPADYFGDVRAARDRVRVPDLFAASVRAAPAEIERAFAAANPGLRGDMMSVVCRRGALVEVRVCFERDLRAFRSCPEVDQGGCRGGDVGIPAPR